MECEHDEVYCDDSGKQASSKTTETNRPGSIEDAKNTFNKFAINNASSRHSNRYMRAECTKSYNFIFVGVHIVGVLHCPSFLKQNVGESKCGSDFDLCSIEWWQDERTKNMQKYREA
jgi:hypothetical protein